MTANLIILLAMAVILSYVALTHYVDFHRKLSRDRRREMREIAGLNPVVFVSEPHTFDPSNPPPPYCWKEFDPMELEGGNYAGHMQTATQAAEGSGSYFADAYEFIEKRHHL